MRPCEEFLGVSSHDNFAGDAKMRIIIYLNIQLQKNISRCIESHFCGGTGHLVPNYGSVIDSPLRRLRLFVSSPASHPLLSDLV